MATARKKAKQQPMLDSGISEDWDVYVHTSGASGRNFPERHAYFGIELRGLLSVGLGGIKDFEITLAQKSEQDLKPATVVGSIVAVKPQVRFYVDLTEHEFAAALALTTSGKPVHVWMQFEKPRYGLGHIHSFAISSKKIE